MCSPPLKLLKVDREAAHTFEQYLQHLQAGGYDLGTDAVASKHRNLEAHTSFHRCCPLVRFRQWRRGSRD